MQHLGDCAALRHRPLTRGTSILNAVVEYGVVGLLACWFLLGQNGRLTVKRRPRRPNSGENLDWCAGGMLFALFTVLRLQAKWP